jgi:branched-chain amino acid transport system ATP-binding protein
LQNDLGDIVFNGKPIQTLPAYARTRLGIARSFQIPRPFHSMTVLENLMVPLAYVGGVSGTKAQDQALEILNEMGLADKAHAGSSSLSQVELRKMELARAMAAKPQLLISDEAMAGLSGSECDDVLDILIKLNKQGITIIMIEHIMQAVMRFSERLVCLDAGQIICDGDPKSVVANPQVQRAYLGD